MTDTNTFDLIVLGAGSGGMAMASRAAEHGARVALLEPGALGGTCVNVGCVPKKAMWIAAQTAISQGLAVEYGFDLVPGALDWEHFVARRERYIDHIHEGYRQRIARLDIELIAEHGRLVGTDTVEAGERTICAPHVVIATGAHARQLDVPGFDLGFTSDGFFDLRACPRRVAIIGGGYIGVEFSGVLNALGAEVCIYSRSHLMRGFDAELAQALAGRMRDSGIEINYACSANALRRADDGERVIMDCSKGGELEPFDALIWAVGRLPNSGGIGLEALDVALGEQGEILTDAKQNSSVPGVYALGDVTGRQPLTPVAVAAGRRLADRLFGGQPEACLDYDCIPSVVFGHPPLAGVGLNEEEARSVHGDAVRVHRSRFTPMAASLAGRDAQSFMKLVCVGADETVVGVHMLGEGCEEMLQGFALAVKLGARKADFDATVAIHPTSSEEMVLME